MKKHMAQYLNEIVSIMIMVLMAIALVAGPATPLASGAGAEFDRAAYQAVRAAGDE